MTTRFDLALARVLRSEGGFVDNPLDRGGPTNLGITLEAWREFYNVEGSIDDIRRLTKATARPIYQRLYWDELQLDGLLYPVAEVVFDQAVLRGRHAAVITLQAALGLPEDGIIGQKTIQAVRDQLYPRRLASSFLRLSAQQYAKICVAHPEQVKFLLGWTDRVFGLVNFYLLGWE